MIPQGHAPVQHAAAALGASLGALGLLGFLPGVTTDLGSLAFAGPHSGATLFGVFPVSVLHNTLHLALAVAGLALATRPVAARGYLLVAGFGYLLLCVHGQTVDRASVANVLPVNDAGTLLHLVLGLTMIALGMLPIRRRRARSSAEH